MKRSGHKLAAFIPCGQGIKCSITEPLKLGITSTDLLRVRNQVLGFKDQYKVNEGLDVDTRDEDLCRVKFESPGALNSVRLSSNVRPSSI